MGKNNPFWIYGLHAVRAALSNPARVAIKIAATARALSEIRAELPLNLPIEPADPEAISKIVPAAAVHQGIALLCEPLTAVRLDETLGKLAPGRRTVAVLDHITDPHNEGAILRSSAAFGFVQLLFKIAMHRLKAAPWPKQHQARSTSYRAFRLSTLPAPLKTSAE